MIASERKMLIELEAAGYSYTGINHIYKCRLPSITVDIILKYLPSVYKERVGSAEHLIRSLISAEEPFDPSVIIDLFENSNYNSSLKWTMAYVVSISKTQDISTWLKDQLLNKESSFERAGFLYGLERKADIKSKQELMNILKGLFDKYWRFEDYLKLFQKYAHPEDISFLQEKLRIPDFTIIPKYISTAGVTVDREYGKNANKRFQRDILKLIKAIKNRKREYRFPPLPKK